MDIRILPSNIANMIAAGEVVQRPASVVKELMENAVDAGASAVTVAVQDAGRTLIRVIDNGCGMSPDQAVLCFERHATSKLQSAEDLQNILTFGFRGEALASIAAVAEVTLKTRREEDEVGCQVDFADSRHLATQEVSAAKGSNFSVRNLFYNVPARRKFLKSDNVEFKHIVTEFIRVALTRPDVGFTLTHNGKDVYVLKPAKSLKFRIQDVLGPSVAQSVVDIRTDTSVVAVRGFVGRPDTARKGLGNQFFFVNGRFFRSPYLHKAVMKAYEGLVPEGVTPAYIIYLEMDPGAMDVNIHPTKTEIKFEDDSLIFNVLYACIKESLGRNSFGESIDFSDREGVPEIPAFGRNFEEFHRVDEPRASIDVSFNPFDNDGFPSETTAFDNSFIPSEFHGPADAQPVVHPAPQGLSSYVDRREDYGKLFEDRFAPGKSVLLIQGRYIVTAARSGMMIINVARARERILYDRFFEALSKNLHVTQTVMFPVSVRVGVENMYLFAEHADLLSSLGFDIAPFGMDTIVVNGVPEGFSPEAGAVESMVDDLLVMLSENHSEIEQLMTANMASRFAGLGVRGGEPMTNPAEAQRLIDALFACENAEYTSSGRRIVSIVPTDELEKRF